MIGELARAWLEPAEGAAGEHQHRAPDASRDVVEHDAGAAAEALGRAGRPGLDLIEQAKRQAADDQRAPGRWRGDPGDENAGDLVDADDLRVFEAEPPLDDARRPDT